MDADVDRPEFYRKLGEAFQVPPWKIGQEMSVVQSVALFGAIEGVEKIENPTPEQLRAILERKRKQKAEKAVRKR